MLLTTMTRTASDVLLSVCLNYWLGLIIIEVGLRLNETEHDNDRVSQDKQQLTQ